MIPPVLSSDTAFTDVSASRLNHEYPSSTVPLSPYSATRNVSKLPACTLTVVSLITFLSMESGFEKLMFPLAFELQPEAVPFHHHDSAGCSGNAKSCRGGVYSVFVITLEPSQPTQYSLTRDQFPGTIHRVSLYTVLASTLTTHRTFPQGTVLRMLWLLFPSIPR